MTGRRIILIVSIAAALALVAFYLPKLVRRVLVEGESANAGRTRAQLSQQALQTAAGPAQTVTLYFPALQDERLLPESRPLALAPGLEDRIRQIVLALIQGSTTGRGRVLSASTEVRAVYVAADGTVYLDLSNTVAADLNPGIESETLAVYAVVDSLATNLPEVKRVQFLLQGQEADTLDGHADLTMPYAPDLSWITPVAGAAPNATPPADGQAP